MKSIQDTAAWTGKNRYSRPFARLDPAKQLRVLLDEFGMSNLHKQKFNGILNRKHREHTIYQVIADLEAVGLKPKSLLNLKQKHVAAVVASWREKGLSASTIQTRLSHLRWLTVALGKRGFVREPMFYGLRAEEVARTYAASEDKSWTGKQVDIDKKIAEARALDELVGARLDLMREFGLRLYEAMLLRPAHADRGTYLEVVNGTKGGRPRTVPIRTQAQRDALERAKAVASRTDRGSLVPPGMNPGQARNRHNYIMRRLGLTKKVLGVVGHGLRHEYAIDLYEETSGEPSAVRGGPGLLSRAADADARRAVTQDLGHARLGVTASYLGPRRPGRPAAGDSPTRAS